MNDSIATPIERMLINQAAVLVTPPSAEDLEDFGAKGPRPRAGTPGRVARIEDSRLWIEFTLPFVDVDGVTWYCEGDVPSELREGLGILPERTLLLPVPYADVALLSWERMMNPGYERLLKQRGNTAADAVALLAHQRLEDAAAALSQVLDITMLGVKVTAGDDAYVRRILGEIIAMRIIRQMSERIQAFFKQRPWFWQLKTTVVAYQQDLHVRIEAYPDAPNPYQLEALDQLAAELTGFLEPEADPLAGRFNLTWENAGYGQHIAAPTAPGAALH